MQTGTWRDDIWNRLDQPWDVLVIGGGITGAGILREATRLGLRTLLVEQRDYSWGTSSRSSKLVHGGLRYLKQGQLRLTRASVQERQRLLEEGPGLIDPLGFLIATYKDDRPGRWTYRAGLSIYDLLALQWSHRYYSAEDFCLLAPHICQEGLVGGFRYGDAQTDDARLVLRLIREAIADGGVAINYVCAEGLLQDGGEVAGARLRDIEQDRSIDVRAKVVINATGAWADELRNQVSAPPRMRPLRGSHLIFSSRRFPLAQAVCCLHPVDRRPLFIFPWEGVTIVGTTDLDHDQPLTDEPAISPAEVAYLMAAVEHQFPSLGLSLEDVISSFAGVRPVIGTGKADPSKEARDHVVWQEQGLLTVTGGKLTTFRLIALDALQAVRHRLPHLAPVDDSVPVLNPIDVELTGESAGRPSDLIEEAARRRLLGRYGADALALVAAAKPGEMEPVPDTQTLWAELRWAARQEQVVHLDDLLLRRVRLGLLLPEGARAHLHTIRAICQPELGWDDERWRAEEASYNALWERCYSLPQREVIPDWRAALVRSVKQRRAAQLGGRRTGKRAALLGLAAGLFLLVGILVCRRRQGMDKTSPTSRN